MAKSQTRELNNLYQEHSEGKRDNPIIACIDMGTNSFHMIVCRADKEQTGFEIISKVKESTPFFRRALFEHYIDDNALKEAERILEKMLRHAQAKGAQVLIAVATSAVRESRNGREVLYRFKRSLDLDAKTISGKEEARLIYLGVIFSMPNLKNRFCIIDIGGGSTEIIAGDRNQCHYAESYKLGAARLTQKYFRRNKPDMESIFELHNEVRSILMPAASQIEICGGFKKLVGTSGTIQTLAKIDRVQTGNQSSLLHGWVMPLERLEEIVAYIERCSLDNTRIKGISADRSETILAGSIVLIESMRALQAESITICTTALREGVIVDRLLQEGLIKGLLSSHINPRLDSVYSLLDKYGFNYKHAEHVAKLADMLFVKTRGLLHNYGQEARYLLWSSAMLHDIGTFITRKGHHKHSYYLIKNSGLLGHAEEEVAIIASVARYHRGSIPNSEHESWLGLNDEAKAVVWDLSAILRIAESLDRGHLQVVQDLDIELSQKRGNTAGKRGRRTLLVLPTIKPGQSFITENWAFAEKKWYFEEHFDVNLELVSRDQL